MNERFKDDRLFLDYNRNNFIEVDQEVEEEKSKRGRKKKERNETLVDALTELRGLDNRAVLKKRVRREESFAQEFIKSAKQREEKGKNKKISSEDKENIHVKQDIFKVLFDNLIPEKHRDATV